MAIIKGKNPRKPWTLRYRDAAGKQREKSFTTRKEADQFATDQEHAKRYRGTDVDLNAGRELFTDAVDKWLANEPWRNDRTRSNYVSAISKWIKPAYEGKTVKEAATTPDILRNLVNVAMVDKCSVLRSRARTIVVGTLNMLVNDGAIESHRVTGVKLAEKQVTEEDSEDDGFVFITDDQVTELAKRVGICVWLQRTMGLRIGEALGVEKSDFINGGKTLRLMWQASLDGKTRVPLKKRKRGQFRDVPVPEYIWAMVKDLPDGPLMPGKSTKYVPYGNARERFVRACKSLAIVGFTTHSLRHQFASECLEAGMNIVDLAAVLGHADPGITLRTYVHAMPNAQDRTRDMMDARWSTPRLKAA